MDGENSCLYGCLFPVSLALLHHLPDHRQGDEKRQVTLLSIAIPTGIGMAVCFLVASAARLLGLA